MLEAMRAYQEVGCTGTVMEDHWPKVGDSTLVGRAIGYLKALMAVLGVYEH